MGITIGTLHLYMVKDIDLLAEFKKAVTSKVAIVLYLFTIALSAYTIQSYFFVGDDFTWFRWVNVSIGNNIFSFFTDSDGFFFRPGTKIYFSMMYSVFWLNQVAYHFVSVFLHAGVGILVFLVSNKILKNRFLGASVAFFFLILSGYHEAVFWISATGFLFTAFFTMLGFLFYTYWREKGKKVFLIFTLISLVISLLFHELGVVSPLVIIIYDMVFRRKESQKLLKKGHVLLLSVILPYFVLRLLSNSHWFSGDYSYNLLNLPFNFIGNSLGYLALGFFGPSSLPFYDVLRSILRDNLFIAGFAGVIAVFVLYFSLRLIIEKTSVSDKKIIIFASLFFVISLLPFLGLGNITSRYSYLASFSIALMLVFLLKKLYPYLQTQGKNIAFSLMSIILIIYVSFQLMQLQGVHSDWREAGDRSRRLFVSLDHIYVDSWKNDKVQLYFVDVPIKNGNAWIFPVGLHDAVWFAYKNENVSVFVENSVEDALLHAASSPNGRVFKFDNNAVLYEVTRGMKEVILKRVQ